ncbi:MAG: DUF58 domain-containing protein [Anaerolineae bacterium]
MSVRRTLVVSIITYTLILVGLGALHSAVVAAAVPFVLYLGAVLLYRPGALRVDASRTLSDDYVAPRGEVEVKLTITNTGSDLDEVCIRDEIPNGLETTGDTSAIVSLRSGESFTLTYTVSGPRGAYRFRSVQVSGQEHFGLFRRQQTLGLISRLYVLPSSPPLRTVMIRPLRTRGFAGPIPSRQGGPGTDFFGVRAYEPGDPPRWINWRLSARHPRELFTNEFERERIADVGLILDARERNDVTVDGESLFEYSVEATAALAETFLGEGNRVGLLVYGRGLERTFPGYGKYQCQRILRALAQAQIGDSLVFDSLDYLPTRFFPAKSQIVLVSPLCEDDPPVLIRLRARGYQVLVVSPNPVGFETQALPEGQARELATRIARAERNLWIHQLRRVGISVVNWQVEHSLDTVIHTELRTQIRQAWRH